MYGGKSDDLAYLQEVLRTAERLGDQAYITRIKAQIEEIKRIQSGSKEDPRRKRGQICKPGLPTMDPMSCRGDHMAKCVKDPKDNEFRCCSNISGKMNCEEVQSSGYGKATPAPTPVPKSAPVISTQVLQDKPMVESPVSTPTKVMTPPVVIKDDEKKIIMDYVELKMSIVKNIEELRRLKIEKDKLVKMTGKTPELVFHNEQNNLDDCIRDESGKVLQC
jgi:hypothetical protein